MTEKYLSLKWNNHSSVFLKHVKEFQIKEKFCDATVVCSGKFFPAHRLVLSSCSDYFLEIFDKSCFKHPFIILKDLKPSVFEALLNYMYKGKVSVPQEIFPELIEAAEFLKIKGLAVPDEEEEEEEKINNDGKSLVPSKQLVSRTRSQRQKLINLDIEEPTISTNKESSSIDNYDMIFDDEDLSEVVKDIKDDLKVASHKNLKIPSKDKKKRKGKMSSSSKRIKVDSSPVIETVLSSSSYKTTSEYSKCVICNEIIKIANFDAHVHEHYEEGKKIVKRNPTSDDKNKDVSTMSKTSDEENTTFKCTSCSYETDSKLSYTTHNESHANEKMMMCSLCSFSSDYPFDIISHTSIHHKPSSDEVVDNTVLLPNNTNYLSFRQNGNESFLCTLCGYVSNRLNILRKHIRKHDTEKLHSCSLCIFKTVHPSMLEFHLTRIHYGDTTNEIYTCLNCDYISISNESIVQHSKLHNDNPDIQNLILSI